MSLNNYLNRYKEVEVKQTGGLKLKRLRKIAKPF